MSTYHININGKQEGLYGEAEIQSMLAIGNSTFIKKFYARNCTYRWKCLFAGIAALLMMAFAVMPLWAQTQGDRFNATRAHIIKNAEQGNAFYQRTLGTIYACGDGVLPQDMRKSYYWLYQAAAQGDTQALPLLREIKKLSLQAPEIQVMQMRQLQQAMRPMLYAIYQVVDRMRGAVSQDSQPSSRVQSQNAPASTTAQTQEYPGDEVSNAIANIITTIISIPFAIILYPLEALCKPQEQRDFERGEKFYNKKNYPKAIESLQKSAQKGHANAQYCLGVMYVKGEGVTTDMERAIYWIRKSADQGNADAQFALKNLTSSGSRNTAKRTTSTKKSSAKK